MSISEKGPTIKDCAAAIERVAFGIPAPNEFTPILMMIATTLRQHHNSIDTNSMKAGIESAYNCIIREAVADLDRKDEPEIKAHFDRYRPALDLLRKAWPFLKDEKFGN
ncbi:MAG: hypothetical protein E6Q97_31430 [Desulfurellales bacterium]|nr:MAG: hypothetical protein E6Q97_31430 [Desulfurellales bacterium]